MRIVFIGTGEIGVPTLQGLLKSEHEIVAVVTQPDKPVGRAQLVEPSAIKKALTGSAAGGRPLSLPILQPARIKERQAIEEIRALKPDVIVVMAYGQILPRDVLEIPKVACLNLHASLLPRWRAQLTFGEMSPVVRCTTDSPKWLLTRSLILWDCLEAEVLHASSRTIHLRPTRRKGAGYRRR